jgi:protein-disulfide isomerase
MTKLKVFLIVACLLAARGAGAQGPAEVKKKGPVVAGSGVIKPTSPVAYVDGKPVRYAEIDAAVGALVRQAEAEYLSRAYDLRRGALDQLLSKRLVELEARKVGKTVAQWLGDLLETVPEPTEDELRVAYELTKDQLSGATFAQVRPALRERLKREASQKRFAAALGELMAKYQVKVMLPEPAPLRLKVSATGPSRGPDDAPVTIVAFADFECPYSQLVTSTLARALDDYAGKVRLVSRQFPLWSHPKAQKAAEASLCAADQGKFWELHDRMYADQGRLAVEDLEAAARELGLDGARFHACLDGGEKLGAVEADVNAGNMAGVQGTPTLFVNGVYLSGAVSYAKLKETIEGELAADRRRLAKSGR